MTEELETTDMDVGLAAVFESLLAGIHTCTIGKVTAFDRTNETVSVQPVLKRKYKGVDDPQEMAVITDVPVVWLGSGNLWLTVDIEVDSYVLLVFCERSIANWIDRGGVVDPQRSRRFDESDAIAIPGINPNPEVLDGGITAGALELRTRDGNTHVRVKDDEISVASDGGGSIVMAASTGTVTINGNLEVLK
jgi:hypothetical protein